MTRYKLLTVTTPAASTDLITLADVREELAIIDTTSDAWLAKVITRASELAAHYCDRDLVVQSYKEEVLVGSPACAAPGGADRLILSRWPVVGAMTITEDNADSPLVDGTDFRVMVESGLVLRISSDGRPVRWHLPLVAEYDAGYSPVPADLQEAVLDLVKMRWYARARDPQLKSEDVYEVYKAEYWFGTGPGGPAEMPAYIAAKLDRYRVPSLA